MASSHFPSSGSHGAMMFPYKLKYPPRGFAPADAGFGKEAFSRGDNAETRALRLAIRKQLLDSKTSFVHVRNVLEHCFGDEGDDEMGPSGEVEMGDRADVNLLLDAMRPRAPSPVPSHLITHGLGIFFPDAAPTTEMAPGLFFPTSSRTYVPSAASYSRRPTLKQQVSSPPPEPLPRPETASSAATVKPASFLAAIDQSNFMSPPPISEHPMMSGTNRSPRRPHFPSQMVGNAFLDRALRGRPEGLCYPDLRNPFPEPPFSSEHGRDDNTLACDKVRARLVELWIAERRRTGESASPPLVTPSESIKSRVSEAQESQSDPKPARPRLKGTFSNLIGYKNLEHVHDSDSDAALVPKPLFSISNADVALIPKPLFFGRSKSLAKTRYPHPLKHESSCDLALRLTTQVLREMHELMGIKQDGTFPDRSSLRDITIKFINAQNAARSYEKLVTTGKFLFDQTRIKKEDSKKHERNTSESEEDASSPYGAAVARARQMNHINRRKMDDMKLPAGAYEVVWAFYYRDWAECWAKGYNKIIADERELRDIQDVALPLSPDHDDEVDHDDGLPYHSRPYEADDGSPASSSSSAPSGPPSPFQRTTSRAFVADKIAEWQAHMTPLPFDEDEERPGSPRVVNKCADLADLDEWERNLTQLMVRESSRQVSLPRLDVAAQSPRREVGGSAPATPKMQPREERFRMPSRAPSFRATPPPLIGLFPPMRPAEGSYFPAFGPPGPAPRAPAPAANRGGKKEIKET